ncbi:MAG TPA: hypothetical protein VGX92_09595 [Pyrinomonadaceae bacterium]|nr:hypothetical protein [Pyrinomonadaceae bacterium]
MATDESQLPRGGEEQAKSRKKEKYDSERALSTLGIMMAAGLLGTTIYALKAQSRAEFIVYASVGIMVSGAAALIGGLLGFLFGIPRTLQQEFPVKPIPDNAKDKENRPDAATPATDYRANTNLEQISDWLTKILVGVGLTQIPAISGRLQQIANAVAVGLGDANSGRSFALAIILFFLICGFLFSYLWTRLYLPGAFREADLSALVVRVERASSQVKQVNRKMEEFEKQAERDATALSLALRQLNFSADAPPVPQEQLNAAIKAASRSMKVQIFNQAQEQRSLNWDADKGKMELTIPIFRALVEDDVEGKYHRNYGQLGYALKDQQTPDWAGALAQLNKAIEVRGPWQENGWLYYEFNRALCNIKLDPDYEDGRPSKPEVRDKIVSDLNAAAQYKLKRLITTDPDIKEWLKLNGLTSKDIG